MAPAPTAAAAVFLLIAATNASPVPHPVERELQESDMSPCQQCCSPGGSCAAAFHGREGVCCGTLYGRPACCPYDARTVCVKCNDAFRCADRSSAHSSFGLRSICASAGGVPHAPRSGPRGAGREDIIGSVIGVAFLAIIGFSICRCIQAAQDKPTYPPGAPPPYGAQYAGNYGPGYGAGPGYGGGGYGAGSVAAAGGAGFLGGMLVGEAIGDAGHGGGYGGGYGGGGGYDDMGGGGDAGFEADS